MSRVIPFSRQFPSYHPQAGMPTYFVEKMIEWYWDTQNPEFHNVEDMIFLLNPDKDSRLLHTFCDSLQMDIEEWKGHTVRAGNKRRVGQKFSPRVWSGTPYNSPQITFLPDLEIKKLWEVSMNEKGEWIIPAAHADINIEMIANNDGLTLQEFKEWFSKPFTGQIICWNELIEY